MKTDLHSLRTYIHSEIWLSTTFFSSEGWILGWTTVRMPHNHQDAPGVIRMLFYKKMLRFNCTDVCFKVFMLYLYLYSIWNETHYPICAVFCVAKNTYQLYLENTSFKFCPIVFHQMMLRLYPAWKYCFFRIEEPLEWYFECL